MVVVVHQMVKVVAGNVVAGTVVVVVAAAAAAVQESLAVAATVESGQMATWTVVAAGCLAECPYHLLRTVTLPLGVAAVAVDFWVDVALPPPAVESLRLNCDCTCTYFLSDNSHSGIFCISVDYQLVVVAVGGRSLPYLAAAEAAD